jgi:hypothetical protein
MGWHGAGIRRGQGRIALDNLQSGEAGVLRYCSGNPDQIGIELHEPGRDIVLAVVLGEDADDVTTLSGTHADNADRTWGGLVQGLTKTPLHHRQPPAQR